MTLLIQTLSHGTIEGGFFSVYTGGFRVGEYAFATQHIHSTLKYLAENPKTFATNIPDFGEDFFWNGFSEEMRKLMSEMNEKYNHFGEERNLQEILDESIDSRKGRVSQHELSLIRESAIGVPLRITSDEEQVSIGQYRLSKEEFQGLTTYVIMGGFFGWSGETPEAAEEAKVATRESSRPLFECFHD